jgi:hypothetical protein
MKPQMLRLKLTKTWCTILRSLNKSNKEKSRAAGLDIIIKVAERGIVLIMVDTIDGTVLNRTTQLIINITKEANSIRNLCSKPLKVSLSITLRSLP